MNFESHKYFGAGKYKRETCDALYPPKSIPLKRMKKDTPAAVLCSAGVLDIIQTRLKILTACHYNVSREAWRHRYHSKYIAARGRMVYTFKEGSEKFKTGICLEGSSRENLRFIKKLIRSYHYRKSVPIFVS
jgi:hypothetical protein